MRAAHQRIGLHLSVFRLEHEVFDGLPVVQDHLGFQRVLAIGGLAEFDQAFGVQAALGVAFKVRRGPGEVDEQSVEDVFGEGARRGLISGGTA